MQKKLFIVKSEVENKNIIVVDDSIVRGNTCKHIINEYHFIIVIDDLYNNHCFWGC